VGKPTRSSSKTATETIAAAAKAKRAITCNA
jgi:hypothetical protein